MQPVEQPGQEHPDQPKRGQPSRMRRILRISLVVLSVPFAVCLWFGHYMITPGPNTAEAEAVVFIPRGSTVEDISDLLGQAGLIHSDVRFLLLTKLMQVSARLPAGEFRLTTHQTPPALIRELAAARPLQHRITIPEGLTIPEIADIFAEGGWADRDRFIELAADRDFIAELGLAELVSLEGYLFPDTYSLVRPAGDERQLLRKLVNQAFEVFNGLDQAQNGLSRHQVFTLASIVEKETGQAEERPLIASVFLNRLGKNMKLQSDPTVIYGLQDFAGTLTRAQLKTTTPYNTYQISGLPPGPICNPGKDALQAVLIPADSNYLYFVSKNDGSHHFSQNLREHIQAVRKYQR